ncbi:DUF6415 family natural product biosynthesis protein [Streptomyces sp. CL12-4]|jgi:hypothetical protein|uniref:DUF6415 family natural product biosynthesis protein n=1 Tax=Streptomyces sp. CL12-4 TaxID=2810306 RepID=UPI001EFB7EA2|nr:hypothetical protein [Streptomyces sp. CL12-4]MCG8970200.1 hypothetical protein [Streptomyces sp. CL12-4]
MSPTVTAEESIFLLEPGQGWRRPSWTHSRDDLQRIVDLLRACLPIDEAYDDVATAVGGDATPTEGEIPLFIARFRGTADSPGHLTVLIDAVEKRQPGDDPHERERLIFRARQVRAETATRTDRTPLGNLRRLASAAEDLLELLLPDDEAVASCPA